MKTTKLPCRASVCSDKLLNASAQIAPPTKPLGVLDDLSELREAVENLVNRTASLRDRLTPVRLVVPGGEPPEPPLPAFDRGHVASSIGEIRHLINAAHGLISETNETLQLP